MNNTSLNNDYMRDLIADMRFCDKCIADNRNVSDNRKYRAVCESQFHKSWTMRSEPKINQFGMPI